ncbi:PA2169 family four-helix-bundle protein [Pedobacter sp. MC2016-14]|uniref:ferritin-like domain-containing protein n=1 Tax=Pedobacter sp. MC2016-14 TaxID=2897327 RepID=UPI001E3367DF|nr:PA2169 family four-helix-bundle protein [Pedobacter sp. MC2016-14]MCD0488709.1 PA2169 family four-helix-bundle protein [Pedobacter sp. MC2016-14]
MESNKEVISDLKELLSIVNDGKEGYESAAEATDKIELQGVFLKYAAQRAAYADDLKSHIATHGAEADNESGGVLGVLHRTWIDIKQALSSKEDLAILEAVVTGEKAAIEKYDKYIADYVDHADHIELLKRQRLGVVDALSEIETLIVQRKAY